MPLTTNIIREFFSIVSVGLLSCDELKSTDWYNAARLFK